jgi:transposase-like protein
MIDKNFKSIIEIITLFPTEKACIQHLERIRWRGKVVSPFDEKSTVYRCKNNRYRCRNTGKYFNLKTGSIFENTKIKLVYWFIAIYLETAHKKGISSCQLARDINVTQKTAWFMLQRIRKCFSTDEAKLVLQGIVEIDETFVGGKNKNRHKNKKVPKSQGRSYKDKTPVFGLIERNGNVFAKVVPNTKAETLRPYIYKHIKKGSIICTDEWSYGNLHDKYIHRQVFHARKIYGIGDTHTNTIEGFWSGVKRGVMGVYHYVSRKHMQLYIDGFSFRYNTRNLTESERFNLALKQANQRLKYKELVL